MHPHGHADNDGGPGVRTAYRIRSCTHSALVAGIASEHGAELTAGMHHRAARADSPLPFRTLAHAAWPRTIGGASHGLSEGVAAFDRDRKSPTGGFRLSKKTPKNALRMAVFNGIVSDALFIDLHRDRRQVPASMLEAWESGGLRTCRELPGWTGLPWSLPLTPGWRELVGAPLGDIVAAP